MFKCRECAKEYEVKPDYCECGNDTFDEVIKEKPREAQKTDEHKFQSQSSLNVQKEKKPKDVISWVIFAICIILSLFVIFFLGNPSNKQAQGVGDGQKQNVSVKKEVKNLPSIDDIWIDNEIPQQGINQVPQTSQEPQNLTNNTQPQPQIQIIKKIVYVPQSAIKQKNTGTVSKSPPVQNNKITQNTIQKQITQPQKPSPVQVKPKNNVKSANIQVQSPQLQKNSQTGLQDLKNYKIALRNKIASNINFSEIAGDGQSTISFKVSSSGKLTDRNFSQLSTNDTLNDALYNAVMKTPAFNPPPAAYGNETLSICLKMYGGNFEIELN